MFPAIIDILRLAFINFFVLEGFLYCIHSVSLLSRPYLGREWPFSVISILFPVAKSSCLNLLWVFCHRDFPVLLKDCVSLGLSWFLTLPSHVASWLRPGRWLLLSLWVRCSFQGKRWSGGLCFFCSFLPGSLQLSRKPSGSLPGSQCHLWAPTEVNG